MSITTKRPEIDLKTITTWHTDRFIDGPKYRNWTDKQKDDANAQERRIVRAEPYHTALLMAPDAQTALWICERLNTLGRMERRLMDLAKIVVEVPQKDSIWTHTNDNAYSIVTVTNLEAGDPIYYPATVVYVGANLKEWSRPLFDWHRSMTYFSGPRKQI